VLLSDFKPLLLFGFQNLPESLRDRKIFGGLKPQSTNVLQTRIINGISVEAGL